MTDEPPNCWNEALHKLTLPEARVVICVLLGRTGMSNEDFIELCAWSGAMESQEGDGE